MQNSSPSLNVINPIMRKYFTPSRNSLLEKLRKEKEEKSQSNAMKTGTPVARAGLPKPVPFETLRPSVDENGRLVLPSPNAEYLSAEQAGFLLGVNHHYIDMMRRDGLLESCKLFLNGKKKRYFYRTVEMLDLLKCRLRHKRTKEKYYYLFNLELWS